MRRAFIEYLMTNGILSPEKLEQIQNFVKTAREPIGSIAFGYGLISGWDIDNVLEQQRTTYRPFGEIAVEKGLLTQSQVDALLMVQQLRACIEIAEALALSGTCETEAIVSRVGRFLSVADNHLLCTQD